MAINKQLQIRGRHVTCLYVLRIGGMARSLQWRRKRPEVLVARTEDALGKTLYIVHQTGPTGFVLKEDGKEKKFKVLLGTVTQSLANVI